MATYHLNVRYCSKSKGQSALAKSKYINRNDKYSERFSDLQFSASGNMPKFAEDDPSKFWEYADLYERGNARVCTEICFALPRELTLEQQQELVSTFINSTINTDKEKLPYSYAIHKDAYGINPHCHLIFSERVNDGIERNEQEFFKRANAKNPELGGAKKSKNFRDRDFVKSVRETWREVANHSLEKYGHSARIDERTLAEQGIDREPQRRVSRIELQAVKELDLELANLNFSLENRKTQAEALREEIKQKAVQEQVQQLKTPEIAQKPPKIANPEDVISALNDLKEEIKANHTMKEDVIEQRQKKAFGFIPWGSEQVKTGEKNVWKPNTPQEIKDTYAKTLNAWRDLQEGKITATQGEEVVKATKAVLAPKPTADELKKQRMAEFAENSRKARESLEKAQQKVQEQNRNQSQSKGIKF